MAVEKMVKSSRGSNKKALLETGRALKMPILG
jgi:hypothetical protein